MHNFMLLKCILVSVPGGLVKVTMHVACLALEALVNVFLVHIL